MGQHVPNDAKIFDPATGETSDPGPLTGPTMTRESLESQDAPFLDKDPDDMTLEEIDLELKKIALLEQDDTA